MTDEELLALVEQTPPDEWTVEQIEAVRQRLTESPTLRQAMRERLRLDDVLSVEFDGARLSPQQIVAAAAKLYPVADSPGRRRWPLSVAAAMVAAAGAAAWVWWPRGDEPHDNSLALKGSLSAANEQDSSALDRGGNRRAPRSKTLEPPASSNGRATTTGQSPPRATEPDAAAADATTIAAPPPVRAAPRLEPWQKERHLGGPARPFEHVAFDDVGAGAFTPRRDELRKWVVGLPGIRLDVGEREISGRRCGALDGVGRLAASWAEDAVLRLAVQGANKLRLYLWRGSGGVMLHYHEDRRSAWAAYVVARDNGSPKPKSFALAATDDERGFRTSRDDGAAFDLYWRDGALVLSRGGIELLAAPLDGPPEEVIFDGRAAVLGLNMTRASGLPTASAPLAATIVEPQPARRTWQATTAAGAQFVQSADGRVELSSAKTSAPSIAYTDALPPAKPGAIYEIVCRIDGVTRGASLLVADEQGRHGEVLRFMREQLSGGVGAWFVGAGDGRQDLQENIDNGPTPLVGGTVWVRLLSGAGSMRAWLSADGVHWASPWPIRSGGPPRRLGIALRPGQSPRRICVGQLAWRELAGVSALAPAELATKADSQAAEPDFIAWRNRVLSQRPPDVDAETWQRASAVAALAGGATGKLAQELVAYLVDEAPRADLPLDIRLQTLNELSLLANTWDDPATAKAILDAFASLADRGPSSDGGEELAARPYTALAEAMIRSPVVTRDGVAPNLQPLARREVLQLINAEQWTELGRLCRVLRFRDGTTQPDGAVDEPRGDSLIDWAEALAMRRADRDGNGNGNGNVNESDGGRRVSTHPNWRGVLVEEPDTNAFHVFAEFQAAVQGQAYREAAEVIAAAGPELIGPSGATGVLPDDKEEGLYVSLRVAVAQAMREHADLASAMRERFGPTARLRVDRAIADGDVAAVEAATLQYCGTAAAGAANLWLGDRALSAGRFARAERHFREAAAWSDASTASEAKHRLRLAAAHAGRRVGQAPSTAVRINGAIVAPGEFEQVVAALLARSVETRSAGDASDLAAGQRRFVAAAQFVPQKRGEFRLGRVEPPRAVAAVNERRSAVDWCARCASMAASGDLVVVNGRASTAAFDAQSGAQRWEASLGGETADPKTAWLGGPARPLLADDRVVLRWMAKNGPVLACLDAEDGRLVWQSQLEADAAVVGDPLLDQGRLFALVARPDALRQYWQLSLVEFDVESGKAVRAWPLVRLAETWRELAVCRATVADDRLYVSAGGVVLCADLAGAVHWVRSLPHVPLSVDGWSYVQSHDAPIVADDRVFVAAPTVRRVVALDAASGRLVWQHGEVDLVKLVGLWDDRLVICTASDLIGLDAGDGSAQWRHKTEGLCELLLGGDARATLVVAEEIVPDQRRRPDEAAGLSLVWLDPASGDVRGKWTGAQWRAPGVRFAPAAVSSAGRIWGLRGDSSRSEVRDVVELFPPDVAVPQPPTNDVAPAPSNVAAAKQLQSAADKTLAGWRVESAGVDAAAALVKHLESDETVLAVADGSRPVVFSRRVAVRPQSQGRLRIKAGYLAGESWQIHVAAGERTLLDATIGGKDEPGWERFELELAPLAGHAATFVVTATSPDGQPRKTLWKRLEVTP